jgi:hypothetical protein
MRPIRTAPRRGISAGRSRWSCGWRPKAGSPGRCWTLAADRGIEAEFATADALRLERLGRRFATVLDCGLFHTFDGDERPGYVASLASVTEHDGTLHVLCFSDEGPDPGPHPISRRELRAAFNPGTGWDIAALQPDRVQTRFHDDGAPAWLTTIKRV